MKIPSIIFSAILFILHVFSTPSYGEDTIDVVVKKGGTLVAICEKHLENPGKWTEVARINRLRDPDIIHPGMRLIIPVRLLRGLPVEGRFTLVHGDVKVRNESAGDWAVVQIGVLDRPDFMIAKPAAPGTYYVRSSSIDKTGEESAFSPAQSFEIRRDIL